MNQSLIVTSEIKQNIKFINGYVQFSNGELQKEILYLKTKQDYKTNNISKLI